MDPMIQWKASTLSLPRTLKSNLIEEDVDNKRKKNTLPPLFTGKLTYEHSHLPKRPVKPEYIDSMAPFSARIEKVLDEDVHIPTEISPIFDTKEDIWNNYEPPGTDVSTYHLNDEDVLIEYLMDGSEMGIIENVSFDTPLTKDSTSKAEQKQSPSMKFSNKAQQFAVAGAHSKVEQKKKSFEELVPGHLHDFANIFTKDGLNCLPPEHPRNDHCIETKPGFILKTSKFIPYWKRKGQRSRLLSMKT
jgi:hypothetical protein